MENPLIDERSHRPIIEGKGTPIDGGVFRAPGVPGIVVDSNRLLNHEWFKEVSEMVLNFRPHGLGSFQDFVVSASKIDMPINIDHYKFVQAVARQDNRDRVSLDVFGTDKLADGTERGGGSPDAQALFVALLIEIRLKKDSDTGRVVYIAKDPTDGHAIVKFETGSHGILKFDPCNGDSKFTKQ